MKRNIQRILNIRKERDWEQFHLPKNLAISLVLEAAEVLEVFQWSKDHNVPEGKKVNLADELADVYYWLLLLAYDMDIDLEKALSDKIDKNEKKYPIDKSKGNAKKYNEFL